MVLGIRQSCRNLNYFSRGRFDLPETPTFMTGMYMDIFLKCSNMEEVISGVISIDDILQHIEFFVDTHLRQDV